ncbi:hypothetical protein [Inhella proteolytica]|uniref:Uncharacterized protein n=1 Tax=Inhella proteolytica TaxID=2795029 RepID=A0A931JA33_9BURK|nr:hypothetical protein [Inhella proteolytica]MBH9579172.1 hypothetical protein [Inhella proteolytica]
MKVWGLRNALLACVAVCLPLPAWSDVPLVLDFKSLLTVAAVALSVAALLAGYVSARLKGVVIAAALLLLLALGLRYSLLRHQEQQRLDTLALMHAEHLACTERVKSYASVTGAHANRIFLRTPAEQELRALGLSVDASTLSPHVEIVEHFPEPPDPASLYVDLSRLREVVPGTAHAVFGMKLVVSDARGQELGSMTDYQDNSGKWCGGQVLSDSIEGLMQALAGRTLGLGSQARRSQIAAPVSSRKAKLLATELKRHIQSLELKESGRGLTRHDLERFVPPTARCEFGNTTGPWGCAQTEVDRNQLSTTNLPYGLVHGQRWLVEAADRMSYFLRLEERALAGRLLQIWHIQLPQEGEATWEHRFLISADFSGEVLRFRVGWRPCGLPYRPDRVQRCFERSATYEVELPKPNSP